jgi:hypothetical protein
MSDDNYDDDFEAYGDDFEDEEASPPKPQPVSVPKAKPPPPKQPPAPVTSVSRASPSIDHNTMISDADMAQLKKSLEIENSEALAKRHSMSKSVPDNHQDTKRFRIIF